MPEVPEQVKDPNPPQVEMTEGAKDVKKVTAEMIVPYPQGQDK